MRQGTLIPINYNFNFNKPEVIGLKKNIDNGLLQKKKKNKTTHILTQIKLCL